MTNAPLSVWNEVRVTSEGISISLISESQDGCVVEDETWFTFDELQEMSPSEPQSLNLSDKTVEELDDQREAANIGRISQADSLEEKAKHLSEIASTDELLTYMGLSQQSAPNGDNSQQSALKGIQVGDEVKDNNPPSWSDENYMKVVNVADKRAGQYVVDEGSIYEKTVYDLNPTCEPKEKVVECVHAYTRSNYPDNPDDEQIYAYPISRVEPL